MKTLVCLFPLVLLGCAKMPEAVVVQSDKNAASYLALGDSYTIGESVAENERYPEQLAGKLRADGKAVNVKIIAKTGWTTDELSAGIDKQKIDDRKFDLVTLLIGVNNEFRGRSVEEYKPEFTALLDRALAFANGKKERVFVVSIPDYSYTPFGESHHSGVAQRIDAFNNAAREIVEARGIVFVDITPISRKGILQPELVADDGLHPSGEQYRLWTEQLYPLVKSVVGK